MCSQALGANNPKIAGAWFQYAVMVSLPFCLIGSIMMWNVGFFVSLLNSDTGIIHYTKKFGHFGFFIIPLSAEYMIMRQFLQGINIVKPAMYVSVICVIINFAFNYLFIFDFQYG